MSKRVVSGIMLILLLIGMSAFNIQPILSQSTAYVLPTLRVVPPLIEYKYNATGKEFTIAVVIENVTCLIGFDIKFCWNATFLEYVNHTVTIPVENYPGGILYEPAMPIINKVNAAAGTYQVAYASLAPAPSFNGSGTVFVMTLRVKYHPKEVNITVPLDIVSVERYYGPGLIPMEPDENILDGVVILYAYEKLVPAHALLDVHPNTLNLRSKGKWITAYIELPEGYDVNNINVSTILLNDTIPVDLDAPITVGDYDNDTILDLMVKFNRTAVSEFMISKGIKYGNVTLTLTGKLLDSTSFEGSDTIKVRMPGDVDCNGKVNIYDVVLAVSSYGSKIGDIMWNPDADLAPPYGIINIYDIVSVTTNYGKTYS